jgi:hypothetical protein
VRAWSLLVLVGVLFAGCKYNRDDFKTPTDPGQQYLQATASASSLPADGISTVEVSARISADATQRTIKFTASLGTLVGGSGSPSSLQVTADSNGVARAALKSSKDLGTSQVTVEVVNATIAAQTVQVAFVAPDPTSVVRFVSAPGNVPADGTTATPIVLAVAAGLPSGDARKVTLTTVLGSFSPAAVVSSLDVTPSPVDNTATVLLYSPQQVGISTLSAKVSEVQRTTVMSFDRAFPDAIRVDLDKLRVPNTADAAGNLNVTAYLTRRTGKVSLDTRVIFEALANGVSVGRFVSQDDLSDADGKVTAVFSPAGVVTPGPVIMTVTVEGSSAVGAAELEVTAPP